MNKIERKSKLERELNKLCDSIIHKLETKIERIDNIKDVPKEVWELATLQTM